MSCLPLLILLAIALLSGLFFIPARPAFRVQIDGGEARVLKGHGIDALLRACSDAAREAPDVSGEISGIRRGEELRLHFSRSLPEHLRQRVTAACRAGATGDDPAPRT